MSWDLPEGTTLDDIDAFFGPDEDEEGIANAELRDEFAADNEPEFDTLEERELARAEGDDDVG